MGIGEAGWSALTRIGVSELPAQDPVLPWPLPRELRLPPTACTTSVGGVQNLVHGSPCLYPIWVVESYATRTLGCARLTLTTSYLLVKR